MDDASNDDNNSSLAPDTCADRSLPSEPAPQVIFVSGDMGPLLCVGAAPQLEATRPRARRPSLVLAVGSTTGWCDSGSSTKRSSGSATSPASVSALLPSLCGRQGTY